MIPQHIELHQSERGVFIGDFVYGANDGIVTTFAVISGAAGASLAPGIVVILGLANLIADGISMGLSNYLSLRSRLDFEHQERKREEREVEQFPDVEKREVEEVFEKWSIPKETVAAATMSIISNKKRWIDFMMREELGIFEGSIESPLKHGAVTTLAFVVAGSLPLIPYLFGVSHESQFIVSIIATACSLFTVGALRTLVTGRNWFRSGLEMLAVGSFASLTAYVVGRAVKLVANLEL